MKLNGKTIVVTGAGSGMGRSLVLELLKRGARVAGVDIHSNTLAETKELAQVGDDRLAMFVADISDKLAVEALPELVKSQMGEVDGVINCAGIIQPFVRINDLAYTSIDRVMRVNFYGTLYMCKSFLPGLLNRPEAHILNVSSMGAYLPVPGQAIYGASKAAVKLMTEALWSELRGTSVGVTIAFPGAVNTNITVNSGVESPVPEGDDAASSYKTLPAEKAAVIMLNAIESNKFRVTVGSDAGFMDKLARLHPRYAASFIAKQMANLLK